MTDNRSSEEEPISFEEPGSDRARPKPTTETSPSPPPPPPHRRQELPPLITDLPRVSHPFINPPQLQADYLYNRSAEDSPSQSRRYIRAGLEISFADFHECLARFDTQDDGDDAVAQGLREQEISPSTASTRSTLYSVYTDTERWTCGFLTESPTNVYEDALQRRQSDLYRWIVYGVLLPVLQSTGSSDDSPGGVHLRDGKWLSESLSPGRERLNSDDSVDGVLLASSDSSMDGGVLLSTRGASSDSSRGGGTRLDSG